MTGFKAFLHKYFIDAFTGMAYGLFVTLIAGLIIGQIGRWAEVGLLVDVGRIAALLMGAGIGAGIAYYLKAPTLVVLGCIVAGMMGAHSEALMAGEFFKSFQDGSRNISYITPSPGNPIGAYLASVFAYRVGTWLSGKTKLDILLVPLGIIVTTLLTCWLVCPPFVALVAAISQGVHAATELQPFLMGIVIAVVMGILLTLPTSSAAIAIAIGLHGIAGGAAVVGCAAQMIGFATASFKENGWGGFIAQGLGTSMLQIPNVMKKPIVMLPAIVASAITGPIATVIFQLQCTPSGAGMGTAGFVGVFGVVDASAGAMPATAMWAAIVLLMFVLPAVIAGAVAMWMRRKGIIRHGDMALAKL
ncbi:PTS sugar transporter subunit IIC [Cardiobacteriaceae bacterium TAE3-ERU3]|nr:PTS sugar transporter subunit IIC [Cardiobacteriaceae bacterium TAE3-ERU3]